MSAMERRSGMSRIPQQAFRRYDETPDEEFYETPRLVTHIDDRAIAAVTQLYREFLPPDGEILDLMSSWVSHLVQNLNRTPKLPFREAELDGAGICVSIDYLTNPVAVLREVGRVLRVGSPVIITFSNRCFPTKAVAVWRELGDKEHMQLVKHYLHEAENFRNARSLDRSPRRLFSDPLYAVIGVSTGPYINDETGEA